MIDDVPLIPPAKPPRADAQKNRRLLLETAARLFEQYGVDAVTMSDLADAAGVGKGTLYRHFSHKTELCHALLDHEQTEVQTRTLQRLHTSNNPPLEDLRWFLHTTSTFVWQNMGLLYVIRDPGAPMTLSFVAHQWWWQTIRGLLRRARVAGDADYLADVLFAMVDVQTLRYQRMMRGYDLARIHTGLDDLIDRLAGEA